MLGNLLKNIQKNLNSIVTYWPFGSSKAASFNVGRIIDISHGAGICSPVILRDRCTIFHGISHLTVA